MSTIVSIGDLIEHPVRGSTRSASTADGRHSVTTTIEAGDVAVIWTARHAEVADELAEEFRRQADALDSWANIHRDRFSPVTA